MNTRMLAGVCLTLLLSPPRLAAQIEGTVVWTYAMRSLGGDNSPAIGKDGTIYVADGDLHAISQDGTERWVYDLFGKSIDTSPCIGSDGTLYVGASDRVLHAVSPDGTMKWTFAAAGFKVREPAIGSDGTIYAWSEDDSLYALNPNGTRKWAVAISGGRNSYSMGSSPVTGPDGTVYVGAVGGLLYAINRDGSVRWTYDAHSTVRRPPAVGPDGVIYIGLSNSTLHAVNPDGTSRWVYQMGGAATSAPALGPDGTLYAGSLDKKLHAINPDGTVLWTYLTGDIISASPAVGADGAVYIGSWDDLLHAVGPDGTGKWTYDTGGNVESSPAIGDDGTVYIASYDGHLHAVHSASPGLSASNWPKYRQNNQNTGTARNLLVSTSDWVEFAWSNDGEGVMLPVRLKNATGMEVQVQTFETDHPSFSLDETLPIDLPVNGETMVTLRVRADSIGLYACHFQVGALAGGETYTSAGRGRVGLFVNDGSERAAIARQALDAFEAARAVDSASMAAENNRGVLFRLLGATGEAESHLSKALDLGLEAEDSYAGTLMNLGVVSSDRDDTGKAGDFYSAARSLVEGTASVSVLDPQIRYNEAWQAYRAGSLEEAHDRADEVVAHQRANSWLLAKALVLRGAIRAEEGDPLGSRLDFESALALDPEGPIGRMAEENLVVLDAAEETDPDEGLPVRVTLFPNYPNPFRSETRIGVVVPAPCNVTLAVYDALGKRVRTLYDGPLPSGASWMDWDARDAVGRPTASGVYLLELRAGGFVGTRKMILLR